MNVRALLVAAAGLAAFAPAASADDALDWRPTSARAVLVAADGARTEVACPAPSPFCARPDELEPPVARWLGPARAAGAVAVELHSESEQATRTVKWSVPATDDVPFTRTDAGVTRFRRGGPYSAQLRYESYATYARALREHNERLVRAHKKRVAKRTAR